MARRGKNTAAITGYESERDELRLACETDLYTFACVMAPLRYFGQIHKEAFRWLGNLESHNKLLLLPRDHQKSFCLAMTVAWLIAREPSATILYLSATATLAESQLYQIKQILESNEFKMLWPNMLKDEVGQRDKWTTSVINVDHPDRAKFGVRDATVISGGINKTITGLHPKYIFLDDLVVPDNAYTKEGRNNVKNLYSQLSSIESSEGYQFAAGTRYHKDDLYKELCEMEAEDYNPEGEYIGNIKVYDVFERVVETNGVFLWPQGKTPDGREFGFDAKLLAIKKAKYLDKAQFYAQYYNDVNRGGESVIKGDSFQYYDPKFLYNKSGIWMFRQRRLNILASIDLAYSIRDTADFTCLMVIGMDSEKNVFILDIDRFRVNKPSLYFEHIIRMCNKWGFRKLVAEVNGPQAAVGEVLKEEFKRNGALISIDEVKPTRHEGDKYERITNILEPYYSNNLVWHPMGTICHELELELMQQFPQHDDCKDALSTAVSKIRPPMQNVRQIEQSSKIIMHPRFGGVMGRRISNVG